MRRRSFELLAIAGHVLCSAAVAAAQSSNPAQRALVYARDPVQSPEPELALLPLAAEGRALQHPWLTVHSCIDAGAFGALHTGERVRVCSLVQSASPDAHGNFAAAPAASDAPASAPDAFAEQMLFYHGGRTLQFFANLGLEPERASTPLRLIANVRLPAAGALKPWRDASFVRAEEERGVLAPMEPQRGPSVYFGRDDDLRIAYDSAAIRHEVSHAALAAWLPREPWSIDAQGSSSAPAAIAEALADYFAAAIVDDPRLGAHAGQAAGQSLTRNLHTRLSCPAALSGDPHQDGLLIASTLWAARAALGDALDRALVAALKKLRAPAGLSVEKLLQSVLDALGPRHAAAARIFRHRGLLPACQRVLDVTPEQSFSGQTGRLTLPGALPQLPLMSSVLQLRAAVPRGATQLELRMRAGQLNPSAADAGTLTPFQPALLVSSAPIRWTQAGPHNATLVSVAPSNTASELHFVVPAGKAKTLYLQVVNRGQRPGWFDAVRVIFRD